MYKFRFFQKHPKAKAPNQVNYRLDIISEIKQMRYCNNFGKDTMSYTPSTMVSMFNRGSGSSLSSASRNYSGSRISYNKDWDKVDMDVNKTYPYRYSNVGDNYLFINKPSSTCKW